MFIEFGGVKFWAKGYRARPGDTGVFGLLPGALDAFTSTAGVAGEDTPRPGSDGSFALPGYLSGKVRGLSAVALARSASELAHLNDVAAGLATAGYDRVIVDRDGRTRWAWASVFGEVVFRPRRTRFGGMHVADVDLSLRTPDPFWFGDVRAYSGPVGQAVAVVHRGTARSWPRFEVAGPVSAGWWLRVDGTRLTVPHAVAAGETVVVERGRVVSSRHGPLTGVVGVSPSVPAGWSGYAHFGGVGGGSVTCRVTDTWLNA